MSWWIKKKAFKVFKTFLVSIVFFFLLACQKRGIDPVKLDKKVMSLTDFVRYGYMRDAGLEESKAWLKEVKRIQSSLSKVNIKTSVLDYLIAWYYFNLHSYKIAELKLEQLHAKDPYFPYQYHLQYLLLKAKKAKEQDFQAFLETIKLYHPAPYIPHYFEVDYLLYQGDHQEAKNKALQFKSMPGSPPYLQGYYKELEFVAQLILDTKREEKKRQYNQLLTEIKVKIDTEPLGKYKVEKVERVGKYFTTKDLQEYKELDSHKPKDEYNIFRRRHEETAKVNVKNYEQSLDVFFSFDKDDPYYFLARSGQILSGYNAIQVLSHLPE